MKENTLENFIAFAAASVRMIMIIMWVWVQEMLGGRVVMRVTVMVVVVRVAVMAVVRVTARVRMSFFIVATAKKWVGVTVRAAAAAMRVAVVAGVLAAVLKDEDADEIDEKAEHWDHE